MLRKYSLFFIVLCLLQSSHSFASRGYDNSYIHCSPELQGIVQTIQKLPDAQKLISKVQEEGPIRIVVNQGSILQEFGAYWDTDERTIAVNVNSKSSEGEIIGSILFELHNALVDSKIAYYYNLASHGQIEKEDYVRGIEYLEYQNSLNASQLASKGIKAGLFPRSAYLHTYRTFEEHYHVQKMSGHSGWIAYTYDQMAPKFRTGSPSSYKKLAAFKSRRNRRS